MTGQERAEQHDTDLMRRIRDIAADIEDARNDHARNDHAAKACALTWALALIESEMTQYIGGIE